MSRSGGRGGRRGEEEARIYEDEREISHLERFLHRFSGLCVSACFGCATLLGWFAIKSRLSGRPEFRQ